MNVWYRRPCALNSRGDRMMFWMKKAAESVEGSCAALVQRAHDKVKDYCNNCGMHASEASKPLMKCGGCSMSYCE